MIALAWNCQGLGSPGKIRFLKDLTRMERPTFVFLSETISNYAKMEELCSNLGFEGFIAVEPQDKRGGASYPDHLIDGFTECLHDTELIDLDITGHRFTWERGRNTEHWIEIRLDRVFANA
ncbi:hypothetical protein POM88_002871 [Heracleum sosnowskyi]|uniref:Endonuclease/exonuclease/phosphatase domain-containing protein n=1 Tax=Heracleum sosnowskyi TaxID=360622 RepID=A0AAD8JGH7_9APIA|nr:hypothetical protein POM88_002871 [Heracleum sosnowskyi]